MFDCVETFFKLLFCLNFEPSELGVDDLSYAGESSVEVHFADIKRLLLELLQNLFQFSMLHQMGLMLFLVLFFILGGALNPTVVGGFQYLEVKQFFLFD